MCPSSWTGGVHQQSFDMVLQLSCFVSWTELTDAYNSTKTVLHKAQYFHSLFLWILFFSVTSGLWWHSAHPVRYLIFINQIVVINKFYYRYVAFLSFIVASSITYVDVNQIKSHWNGIKFISNTWTTTKYSYFTYVFYRFKTSKIQLQVL